MDNFPDPVEDYPMEEQNKLKPTYTGTTKKPVKLVDPNEPNRPRGQPSWK